MGSDSHHFQPDPPHSSPFDVCRHVDPDGTEWWSAREVLTALGYADWDEMVEVIDRAKAAGRGKEDTFQFKDVVVRLGIPGRTGPDVVVNRLACYTLAMNGDSVKYKAVAYALGYFYEMTCLAEGSDP